MSNETVNVNFGKFTASGNPDVSFGSGGLVTTEIMDDSFTNAATVLFPNNEFLVLVNHQGGAASGETFFAKFNANGTLKTSFGSNGYKAINMWMHTGVSRMNRMVATG